MGILVRALDQPPCIEAGVDASGETAALGDTTVYRMTNGSIAMCG